MAEEKNHSTLTAKCEMDHNIGKGTEKKELTVLVSTDMSMAYDLIDVSILIRKLKFYGFEEKELKLFTSLLTKRKTYIELEGKVSTVKEQLDISVMQGSKLSRILFLIYCNEVN